MRIKIIFAFVLLFHSGFLPADELPEPKPAPTGSVTVTGAWVELGKEDAIMFPGFAVFASDASDRWVLQKVTARHFRAAMIHRTVLQDGEPRMVLQSSMNIRPGEVVRMSKQNYHLMFVGPRKKIKVGDKIKVVLHFENQPLVKMNFPVLKKAPKK